MPKRSERDVFDDGKIFDTNPWYMDEKDRKKPR